MSKQTQGMHHSNTKLGLWEACGIKCEYMKILCYLVTKSCGGSCIKTKLCAPVDKRLQISLSQRNKHLSICQRLTRHSSESNETLASVSQHSYLFQLWCHYILEYNKISSKYQHCIHRRLFAR